MKKLGSNGKSAGPRLTPRERWAVMLTESFDRAKRAGRIEPDVEFDGFLQWVRQSDVERFQSAWKTACDKIVAWRNPPPPTTPGTPVAMAALYSVYATVE